MEMDKSKSLQELEGVDEGDPKSAPTNMIRRCMELHRTPLEQWSAEDCRLMLGQKFSPKFLVPMALEFLDENPPEEGTMYPGALLNSVLRLPSSFWMENQEWFGQVQEIALELESLRRSLEVLSPAIHTFQTLMVE